ncbi:hypothetical protein [Patulibacter sp.]|uniref:hypothetical protein n=1 Tax=Patulibacter sp. TaxID=1912859 RepID=UPI0027235759|nr:hypothetical protein [Patulibacter sp.]MDO9408241.1 hypothetical protein [Patulibacter sp.]
MSRFGSIGSLRSRSSSGGGSKSAIDVDPVMAAILGVVVLGGGGLALYGASQETEPDPAPAAIAQPSDPVVERALRIVERVDGTAAAGEGVSTADAARERRRAARASAAGRSADPFAAITSGTDAVTGVTATATPGSASGAASGSSLTGSSATAAGGSSSSAKTARELAERAAAQSAAANAAAGGTSSGGSTGSTGGTGSTGTGSKSGSGAKSGSGSTGSPAAPTAAARRAAVLRAVADRPAKISLRVNTASGRSTRSKRSMGLLVPSSTKTVARVVGVSRTNQVVTLRLREGAALTGKQSKGTRCVERLSSGDCRLVRVHTGRTAVIRAPRSAGGRPGAVTALRVTAIWRGGYKVAG